MANPKQDEVDMTTLAPTPRTPANRPRLLPDPTTPAELLTLGYRYVTMALEALLDTDGPPPPAEALAPARCLWSAMYAGETQRALCQTAPQPFGMDCPAVIAEAIEQLVEAEAGLVDLAVVVAEIDAATDGQQSAFTVGVIRNVRKARSLYAQALMLVAPVAAAAE